MTRKTGIDYLIGWAADIDPTWISLGIAFLAVLVSVFSTQYMARSAKVQSRQENYVRLHEQLVSPDASSGRRLLFQAHTALTETEAPAETAFFPLPSDDVWDRVNYSLALYDTLGGYIHRKLVDKDVVLEAWHHPLQNISPAVNAFMEHRRNLGIDQPWAHLLTLLESAREYVCTCPHSPQKSSGPDADSE